MNSSGAANFTDSPELCSTGPAFHFQVTTDVLVLCILSCLLDVIDILISIPANLLVILVISLNSSLHHNADYVLLVLAVSDLLIGALMQPLLLVNKIQHLLSRPSCTTATVYGAVRLLVPTASIISEMLVSLERTIAVLAPYWYEEWVTPRRLFAVPMCAWFTWVLVDSLFRFWSLSLKTAHLVTGGFVAACLLVTAVCYGLLVKVANHHENQVQAQHQQVQRSEEEKKKMKREKKALWTALYINGAYFVGYLPIIPVVIILATVNLSGKELFLIYSWATTLGISIASANPIILCWRNTRLGREMKKLLRFDNDNSEAVQPQVEPPVPDRAWMDSSV